MLLSAFYSKLKEVQARTQVKRAIIADVPDYVPAPFNALVKRKLHAEGLMVDVPEGSGVYAFRKLLDAHPETPPKVSVSPDDTAFFQYTGGTTGVPKAAMLSHFNLVANTVQVRRWMVTLDDGKERVMGAIPFFHVYGMTVAMSLAMYIGAQLIVVPNPRPIDGVMKAIDKERATVFPGVPTMYIGIINHPDVGKYDLKSVKACISGAAPLPMDVQTRFGEITGGRLVEGYGLTEAAPVSHCNPIYGQRKAGSIGLPFPDVEAKIMDYERLVEKPQGEDGESWLRGPQVMQGYWGRPDETAKTITEDGWLRTGDIARMDSDGYFYIVDRLKDIIIASGFNIVPRGRGGALRASQGAGSRGRRRARRLPRGDGQSLRRAAAGRGRHRRRAASRSAPSAWHPTRCPSRSNSAPSCRRLRSASSSAACWLRRRGRSWGSDAGIGRQGNR